MTLVISLGLDARVSRYEDDVDDVELRARALLSLVERGHSLLLREIVWRAPARVEGARVYEAARVEERAVGRWLDEGEARPLVARVADCFAQHDSFISFAYGDDLDARGGIDTPELAFVADGPVSLPRTLDIGTDRPVLVGDLSNCWLGTGADRRVAAAWAYRDVARALRLVMSVG